MRLNRIFGKQATGESLETLADTICPHCGASIPRSRRCPECSQPAFSLPGWALSGRERRFITRKRLIVSGGVLAVLLFVFWLNYPFLPNYGILLFNRPTTEASSNSTIERWTMAGGDLAQRKMVFSADRSQDLPTGTIRWRVPTGEGTRAGPIVADGVVYQGGYFKVVALDADTGELIWSQPTSGPVQTSLALAGGRLYAGFLDHHVRALAPDTGEVVWEFRTGDIITSSPVVHDGILYLGAWDNLQYALDAATGEVIWTYEATDKVSSHSPVAEGIMAVPDKGAGFTCWTPEPVKTGWSTGLPGPPTQPQLLPTTRCILRRGAGSTPSTPRRRKCPGSTSSSGSGPSSGCGRFPEFPGQPDNREDFGGSRRTARIPALSLPRQ